MSSNCIAYATKWVKLVFGLEKSSISANITLHQVYRTNVYLYVHSFHVTQ